MSDELVNFEVGQSAPDFEAELTDGTTIRLSEILEGGEKVILYFYPKDSTPGCTKQACDFRDNFDRLKAVGYRVIGVSKDCLLYTSPSPRDKRQSRMPSSA